METTPNFVDLARTAIEIFHPEILDFPEEIVEKAIEFKAEKLKESYLTMLNSRK